jgi:hypothetical protein
MFRLPGMETEADGHDGPTRAAGITPAQQVEDKGASNA